jgi:hypothetical protein
MVGWSALGWFHVRPLRPKARLRPLDEAEAYARCHGDRGADVRIVHIEPRRPRYETNVSGEELRRSFEERLDARLAEPAGSP